MYQTYVIISLSVVTLMAIMYAAKAWQTARSLRQLITLGPEVCEICATKASTQNHDTTSGDHTQHTPGNGGIYFADTHMYVPSRLVFIPHRATPGP